MIAPTSRPALLRTASPYLFALIVALAGSGCSSNGDDGPITQRQTSSENPTSSAGNNSSAPNTDPVEGEDVSPANVAIEVENDTLSTAGATAIHLNFTNDDGEPVAATGTWTADSRCLANETASISAPVTNESRVSFAYTANGCVGEDIIIFATAGSDDEMQSYSTTLTIEADQVAFISWQSTEPAHIAIRGSGGREKATITFRLNGETTNAVAGQEVHFRIEGEAGGVRLVEESAVSDANGLVRATVLAGSTPNVVTVVARHAASLIEAPSGGLVVATGLPSASHFNVALSITNPNAWRRINEPSTEVTVALTDRMGNPVVDGTKVNFVSPEAGSITESCRTENNTCTVTWKPDGRNPSDGRARILATAKGTEDFIDNNGNNIFDDGDSFEGFDLGEPYIDSNGNGQYDLGEYFVDTNNSGERDGPDGVWNGYNCEHSELCAEEGYHFIDIGAHATVYMSHGANATICELGDFGAAELALTAGDNITLGGLYLSDGNSGATNPDWVCPLGNPLPVGTEVSFSVSAGTLIGKTSWTIPSNANLPTGAYGIRYTNDSPGLAILAMSVDVPGEEGREFYWDIIVEEDAEEE